MYTSELARHQYRVIFLRYNLDLRSVFGVVNTPVYNHAKPSNNVWSPLTMLGRQFCNKLASKKAPEIRGFSAIYSPIYKERSVKLAIYFACAYSFFTWLIMQKLVQYVFIFSFFLFFWRYSTHFEFMYQF